MPVVIVDAAELSEGELAWLLRAELEAEPPVDETERLLALAERILRPE